MVNIKKAVYFSCPTCGASEIPPCDARCPRSECEEELACGMSSEGPNLKRGTPATWGELINKKHDNHFIDSEKLFGHLDMDNGATTGC